MSLARPKQDLFREKVPTLKNLYDQEYFSDMNDSTASYKPKDCIFRDFTRYLASTRSINVQARCQSFCNNESFINLTLPIFLVLARQREKSREYFYLFAFNQDLNHSNL